MSLIMEISIPDCKMGHRRSQVRNQFRIGPGDGRLRICTVDHRGFRPKVQGSNPGPATKSIPRSKVTVCDLNEFDSSCSNQFRFFRPFNDSDCRPPVLLSVCPAMNVSAHNA